MRIGFAVCISATFAVGIMGVNDRVGIVRAVGADGSPVIEGNEGRPVIVGKRGTVVKNEYAVFVIVDPVVEDVFVAVGEVDIVIFVAPVATGVAGVAAATVAARAVSVILEGVAGLAEDSDDILGMTEPVGLNKLLSPDIDGIMSILLSSRIY
jgi:hypothetical protein